MSTISLRLAYTASLGLSPDSSTTPFLPRPHPHTPHPTTLTPHPTTLTPTLFHLKTHTFCLSLLLSVNVFPPLFVSLFLCVAFVCVSWPAVVIAHVYCACLYDIYRNYPQFHLAQVARIDDILWWYLWEYIMQVTLNAPLKLK